MALKTQSMFPSFTMARTPLLCFGPGKIGSLVDAINAYGSNVLLIIGEKSLLNSKSGKGVFAQLDQNHISYKIIKVSTEPTPSLIDDAVTTAGKDLPDVIVAIGGGSVIDAGKAISAMLPLGEPVKDYLEGIGTREHPGKKIPFIAVPTTAGTGSEATKNSVITQIGSQGFKRSLRHENFVPDLAIVDSQLTLSCPSTVTASSGMDAFTQLLESYVSLQANHITDALAIEGLRRIASSLKHAYVDGTNLAARNDMALAAYLSGITLANAGLGVVHGFASSIGGNYAIPHGVICSAMMAASNLVTIRKLRKVKSNPEALTKYASVGRLFYTHQHTDDYYIDALIDKIVAYRTEMKIPTLRQCGVHEDEHNNIAQQTGNKYNPISLDKEEILEILELSA